MKLEFWVTERENRFRKKGKEHALYCKIGDDSPFCIIAYESKPTKQELIQAKEIAKCALYSWNTIKWFTKNLKKLKHTEDNMNCPCCERNTPNELDYPNCPHCGSSVNVDFLLSMVESDSDIIEWECERCSQYFDIHVTITFEVTK